MRGIKKNRAKPERSVIARIQRINVPSVPGRAKRQEVLAKLGTAALKAKNIQTLLDEVARGLARAFDLRTASIWEMSDDGTTLLLRSGVGEIEGEIGVQRVPTGPASMAGYTVLRDKPVVMED